MSPSPRMTSKNNPEARGLNNIVPECTRCSSKMVATRIITGKRKGMFWLCDCGEMVPTRA